MKIIREEKLRDFEFKGDAKLYAIKLSDSQLDKLDDYLDNEYPYGVTEWDLQFWMEMYPVFLEKIIEEDK